MTIVTRRALLVPYNDSLQSEFLMLNCCATNRAEMNGPHTVSSAKRLFNQVMNDENVHAMAVLDSLSRDYIGHVFISGLNSDEPELGFLFDKKHWGKGFASEVLQSFFPKAIYNLGLSKVVATANVGHMASIRILSKLGFVLNTQKEDMFGPYGEYVFTSDVAVEPPLLVGNLA
ncbi:N-acetyltransferase [Vibrio aquaticus]|uniref:N-acetyltransferase n=1 Tax=Vibrio aquaticus TaxID=2496559 RepID=A0A432CUU9_9VIBR|nr:GNAT family N-acetyltransferase [Vibrio aquaticus]RTZ15387.1 N-acetyltransferase [Vibrio aquaticus]